MGSAFRPSIRYFAIPRLGPSLIVVLFLLVFFLFCLPYTPLPYNVVDTWKGQYSNDDATSHSEPTLDLAPDSAPATLIPPQAGAPSNNDDVPEADFASLTSLCSATTWTPGLWIFCNQGCGQNRTSFCGGLNNARNRVQTCLRWGIDAGANIVLPTVMTRKEDDLVNVNNEPFCPDTWFDTARLKALMAKHCPQMAIDTCGDANSVEPASTRRNLAIEFRSYMHDGYNTNNHSFREWIHARLEKENISLAAINPAHPVVIEYGDVYLGWNYAQAHEMSTIRKALFKLLNYNPQLLSLGHEILAAPELQNGKFLAVHLRGESDWPSGFGTAADQRDRYLEAINRLVTTVPDAKDLKTVYVSCGDRGAVQSFRNMLEPLGFVVHDKWTLGELHPEIIASVDQLPFDRKGVVEYEVMRWARYFMGVSMSSMSLMVAYSRTVNGEKDWFDQYLYPGTVKTGLSRSYSSQDVKGNGYTGLMSISGHDLMDQFP
jgi:hypothetical protein